MGNRRYTLEWDCFIAPSYELGIVVTTRHRCMLQNTVTGALKVFTVLQLSGQL